MTTKNFIARVEVDIQAEIEKIWDALINPALIKKYMFGSTVVSTWKPGSSITWSGEWEGKTYEDHGKILAIDPPYHLQYSHISASGQAENDHIVDIRLSEKGNQAHITLTQDNNKSEEMKSMSEKNWTMMLNMMKKMLEG